MNMFKYMISIIEIIQQYILHHKEFDELKAAENSDAINEFNKSMNTFSSNKNAINHKIFHSLISTDDELKNLIEIDDDEIEIKYSKLENDAKMMKNEYEKKMGGWYPPPKWCMSQSAGRFHGRCRQVCGGPPLGELSGGNWMARTAPWRLRPRGRHRAGCRACPPPTGQRFWPPPGGGSPAVPASAGDLPVKIVTWLILPVVICLSQRLSHACLSISNLYGETANGSLNQLSFI